jgi:hypothetical protein
MSRLIAIALAGLAGLTVLAAPAEKGNDERVEVVRGLYMDRAKNPDAAGARYHILLEGKDGNKTEVPPTHNFKTGDRFWLQLEVRKPVYVYVLNRTVTAAGKGLVMDRPGNPGSGGAKPPSGPAKPANAATKPPVQLPPLHLVFGPEKVDAGAFKMLPGRLALKFNQQPGLEKLYIVLSDNRIPELDRGFGSKGEVSGNPETLDKELVTWADNAELAVPEANSKGLAIDSNAYAMQRKRGQPVMLELSLEHLH